jgi:AhpD family alkylhydroperoxidase
MDAAEAFQLRRAELQALLEKRGDLPLRRFLALDRECYAGAHLDAPVKELLGLTASLVLRCDDCVHYHLGKAAAAGWTDEQIREALSVAVVIGGSITIPHLRRAYEFLEALRRQAPAAAERRRTLTAALRDSLRGIERLTGRMATTARLLFEGDRRFFWVGFYLKLPTEDVLEIGPYQGPPPCVRIPFDKGVCGEAARTHRTIAVSDVRQLPHYIACHSEPRSEVVVPLLRRDEAGETALLGVLDGDSVKENAFDEEDVKWLEEIGTMTTAGASL